MTPNPNFVSLTRNPALAENPPERWQPTQKRPGDVVILSAAAELRAKREAASCR